MLTRNAGETNRNASSAFKTLQSRHMFRSQQQRVSVVRPRLVGRELLLYIALYIIRIRLLPRRPSSSNAEYAYIHTHLEPSKHNSRLRYKCVRIRSVPVPPTLFFSNAGTFLRSIFFIARLKRAVAVHKRDKSRLKRAATGVVSTTNPTPADAKDNAGIPGASSR